MEPKRLFLAGRFEAGEGAIAVRSPYDGATVAEVARAGPREREEAVRAAADAAPALAAWPAHRRVAALEGARAILERRAEELAALIRQEAGKPVALARVEARRALDTLAAAARVARSPVLEALDLSGYEAGEGRLALVRREPVGPVLAISPFNFPLNLVLHKVAPAVAAGCPVVLKPASQTPSPALLVAEAFQAAGLPEGALSVIPCAGSDATTLVEDPRFALVTFTGSDVVGFGLRDRAGRKRVTLELGGNAAVLVEPDGGDLAQIARRVAGAAYGFAGQSCISVQRVLVNRAVLAPLRDALVAATEELGVGDPADPSTVCGPLVSAAEAARVVEWSEAAVKAGARRLTGGEREGNVVSPVLLEDAPRDADVVAREVFGPVAVLQGYDDFEEGLALADDTRYGLQAGVFTRDVAKVRRAWDVLRVGAVIQGDVPSWRCDPMPYGGVRDSGQGREGPAWAVREMTVERLLVLGGA
jgi:acyl-CoA reductase-like NAD-dependent aldehyde dehydrogenase